MNKLRKRGVKPLPYILVYKNHMSSIAQQCTVRILSDAQSVVRISNYAQSVVRIHNYAQSAAKHSPYP